MPRPRDAADADPAEVEWKIRPLLEEWAEVASFDAPGRRRGARGRVLRRRRSSTAGVAELERLGWDELRAGRRRGRRRAGGADRGRAAGGHRGARPRPRRPCRCRSDGDAAPINGDVIEAVDADRANRLPQLRPGADADHPARLRRRAGRALHGAGPARASSRPTSRAARRRRERGPGADPSLARRADAAGRAQGLPDVDSDGFEDIAAAFPEATTARWS